MAYLKGYMVPPLNGLPDTSISNPAANQYLGYNATSQKWENKVIENITYSAVDEAINVPLTFGSYADETIIFTTGGN